jgi:arginine utilization protein RocB
MRNVRELLLELIRVRSVTGTVQERDAAQKILELIREDPYFQEHADCCGAWDGGDALHRPVVWALKKGSGRRTVVFSGHYDTVDTACYGIFEPFALDPDALKAAMRKAPSGDAELMRDLTDENWLFGRGSADMKAGLALNLNALYGYEPGEENVLFTAVSDEENLSAGARQAVNLYGLLQERFGLDYAIGVISESSERDTAAHEPHPFVNGCAGKILPVVVAKGIPAHGACMLRGLNPAHLIANVIRETEYDTALLSHAGSLFTEPPTVLMVRDLKAGYDVSMPEYAAAAFNVTFFSGPDSVKQMDKLLKNCNTAADDLLARYNDCMNEMERAGKTAPGRRRSFAVRVLTLEQLVAEISTKSGFEDYRRDAAARSVRLIASGETLLMASILYIRDLMAFAGGGPMLVAGIAPPYYPAVSNASLGKDITPIVQDVLRTLERQGIRAVLEEYSKDMMDLSYMSCADPESALKVMGSMPLPASVYDMDIGLMAKLAIPTLVIGPAGKEIHMPGERVYLPDVERDMPAVFRQIIKSVGEFGL